MPRCPAQDVLPHLDTVREALTTAALLRLPRALPREAKLERVEELLELLVRCFTCFTKFENSSQPSIQPASQPASHWCSPFLSFDPICESPTGAAQDLVDCADLLIGDSTMGARGLSGGQRRRVTSEQGAEAWQALPCSAPGLLTPAHACNAPALLSKCTAVGIELIKARAQLDAGEGVFPAAIDCPLTALRCAAHAPRSPCPASAALSCPLPAPAALQHPQIVFLDEPLSGLDSESGEQVVRCLARLARKGHTVLLSIHQASGCAREAAASCMMHTSAQRLRTSACRASAGPPRPHLPRPHPCRPQDLDAVCGPPHATCPQLIHSPAAHTGP